MKKMLALCLGALVVGACGDLNVPDLNNPSLELLQTAPTRSAVSSAATGLLIGHRVDVASSNGYVVMLGILGREAYNFDAADPRYITEMLAAPQLDPGSPRFGGNFWQQPYANIRNANLVLSAVEKVAGMSDAEKEATRGFAKTIQALDFMVLINTRDTNGLAVDVSGPITELGPIVTREEGFAHVVRLLDQAKAHLQAGGDAFPFALSSGFKGFDTPATFLKFNRAVKARVDVYQRDWNQALADLNESFLDVNAPLSLGVYHVFGTGSGDTLSGLINPNIYVHPSIVTGAEKKPNNDLDDRVTRKVHAVKPRTVQDLTSSYMFSLYPTNTTPVPIIRNEELILLRAEANIGLGNLAPAIDDINFIRVNSGGLPPRTDLTADNIIDELLKQREYSLLFEGGHRWIDARRYGRLDQLPRDLPTHSIHARFPIPVQETDARQ